MFLSDFMLSSAEQESTEEYISFIALYTDNDIPSIAFHTEKYSALLRASRTLPTSQRRCWIQ